MKAEELSEGMRVTYVPMHANGSASHPDCERGIVSSWRVTADGRCNVFVRYGSQQHAQSTDVRDLVEG